MIRRRIAALITAFAVAALPAAPANAGEAPAPQPAPIDPNYSWHDDAISKVLAGKPFADYVLHRVPGSFHDAPRIPRESNEALQRGNSLYGPGTPIYVGEGDNEVMCTVAVAGYGEHGNKYALTAGHCGKVGDPVSSADSWQVGHSGNIVKVNERLDYALIELGSNAEVTRSYDGVTINHLGSAPVKPGKNVCKKGVASGETCGITWSDWNVQNVNQVCAMQGDSGAPLYTDDRLVGMINGGLFPAPFDVQCTTPLQGPIYAPTSAARMDAILADLNNGFRLP
ncbi:trypsin [Corynebacterium hadale]|uniref:Trypsin n=1 Tax=Corynebacterium hadale TaxID=2026255 RepID=A0ABX4H739_9CORY|nr:S1 family peptidase [Corynebacterium hadale]PAT05118.1 trypsin [Corynebacterium hadale]